jgi:hypothetical protein
MFPIPPPLKVVMGVQKSFIGSLFWYLALTKGMDPNAATHTFDKTIRDKQESSDRTEQSKKKGRIAHVTGTWFRKMSYRGTFLRMGMATGSRSSTGHLLMKVFRNIRFTARNLYTGRPLQIYLNTSNACKCSKYPI